MSLHKSLKLKNSLVRRRNVLSRGERIQRLKAQERWVEGEMSVFGLPKVKSQVVTAPAKPVKKREQAEEGAAGTAGAEGAAAGGAAAERARPKK